MKRKITIDTLLNQTLGFNTKSFSESKPIMKPTKRFNYGEVGNAMLVFEIDRYMMKAEAANSRTRLATQFATGEASIVDSVKKGVKNVWAIIVKLFKALQDMVKNFIVRHSNAQEKLEKAKGTLAAYGITIQNKQSLFSKEIVEKAKKEGTKFKIIKTDMNSDINEGMSPYFGIVEFPEINPKLVEAYDAVVDATATGVNKFLNTLVYNGADEACSTSTFEEALTKDISRVQDKIKSSISKYKKEGPTLETVQVDAAMEKLTFTVEDLYKTLDLATNRKRLDFIKGLDKSLTQTIKNFQKLKDSTIEGVSEANTTKTRIALGKISSYLTTHMDAMNVSAINLTKAVLITVKNINALNRKGNFQ